MTKKQIFLRIVIICLILDAIFIPFAVYSNTHLDMEYFTCRNNKIPEEFNGTVIAHLSDYHNHGGKYDDKLMDAIRDAAPDYIFITGDTADRILTDIDKAEGFLERVSETAPCYLVWGNHEKGLKDEDFDRLESFAKNAGITVLEDETVMLEREGAQIALTGDYNCVSLPEETGTDYFDIWLHHFPEDFEDITDMTEKAGNRMDLMFAGHAHGGLIRLPFIKGLVAPGQGLFPKYTSGVYTYKDSEMIVSRGLGNSSVTRRLFNPFHLVVCTLESEQ